jgi:CheY-like chemotaxis protein
LRFNNKRKQDYLKINKDQQDDDVFDLVDVITVDNQSRLTFTRNLKKILSVNPYDRIIVYQHRNNKNIIFKVQRNDGFINRDIRIIENSIDSINHRDTTTDSIKNKKSSKDYESNNKDFYLTPILLVDDENDLLEYYEYLLRSEGYKNIKGFSDSKNMLKYILNDTKFKLAILDIRMPDLNGIQLYIILKILNPFLKILLMTAFDEVNELTSMMIDIDPQDIMKKPLNGAQFIEKVSNKIKAMV